MPGPSTREMAEIMTEILRYEVCYGTVPVEVADNSFGIERPSRNE